MGCCAVVHNKTPRHLQLHVVALLLRMQQSDVQSPHMQLVRGPDTIGDGIIMHVS